jgi:hypothetical protein
MITNTVEPADQTTETGLSTMTAVIQHRYGPADTLTVGEAAVPVVGPDEVLIAVPLPASTAAYGTS